MSFIKVNDHNDHEYIINVNHIIWIDQFYDEDVFTDEDEDKDENDKCPHTIRISTSDTHVIKDDKDPYIELSYKTEKARNKCYKKLWLKINSKTKKSKRFLRTIQKDISAMKKMMEYHPDGPGFEMAEKDFEEKLKITK